MKKKQAKIDKMKAVRWYKLIVKAILRLTFRRKLIPGKPCVFWTFLVPEARLSRPFYPFLPPHGEARYFPSEAYP